MNTFAKEQLNRYRKEQVEPQDFFEDADIRAFHMKSLVRIIRELCPDNQLLHNEAHYHLLQFQKHNQLT